jgi:hypothetical protein
MGQLAERPWNALPPSVAATLEPELPRLADEIIDALRSGVPDYARPLEGPFGAALRVGVEEALRQFLEMVERPGSDRGPGREVYIGLGRGEWRAGRGLDALLAAYRLGARVAWRRLAAAGERAGIEPRVLYLLAEAIFAYIDELSAESIEGYAAEQAAAAGQQQRRRRRLATLLVRDPPADRAVIEEAAAEAGVVLPRTVAAVAVAGEEPDRLALRLGPDVVAAPAPAPSGDGAPPQSLAVVPDPDAPGRRAQLAAALEQHTAAVGPAVPWAEAGLSAARARAALWLAGEGLIEAAGLIDAGEHALALMLHADRRLARDLGDDAVAPLASLRPSSRERMEQTLLAWLRLGGRTEQVAAALHVHPQTVRYRLGRLRELYGDRLEDPDERFRLQLALRARSGTPAPG